MKKDPVAVNKCREGFILFGLAMFMAGAVLLGVALNLDVFYRLTKGLGVAAWLPCFLMYLSLLICGVGGFLIGRSCPIKEKKHSKGSKDSGAVAVG